MVVYCIKFVLRGESPREKTEPYVDILRSLAFPPSINIFDMPDMQTTPFSIFAGQTMEDYSHQLKRISLP